MRNALIFSLVIAAHSGTALADGIEDICMASGGEEASCACAFGVINDAFPPENMAAYEAVARHYLGGAGPEGDWNAAYGAAAREMGAQSNETAMRANEVGRAHQTAIRLCGIRPAPAEGANGEAQDESGVSDDAETAPAE